MKVRAKMRCTSIAQSVSNYGPAPQAPTQSTVKLQPVSGPGNEEWSKYTPSGEVTMNVTNPDAIAQFVLGKDYYVDFTAIEPEATPQT